MPTSSVLIDDRLLVAELTGASALGRTRAARHTTTWWWYRACRAAVVGGAGQLSGPFARLEPRLQARAIAAMLRLPDDIGLPDPRALVPAMVDVAERHPRLNALNLEAVAAARLLGARVLLSPPGAAGLLPGVLDAEGVAWATRTPPEP